MNQPTDKQKQEARELSPCPFCGVRMIRSGLDQPHWQQWWEHEDRETSKCVLRNQTISDASKAYKDAWNTRSLSSRDREIREVLEGLAAQDDDGFCWCPPRYELEPHTAACLAARGLWNRVNLTESAD